MKEKEQQVERKERWNKKKVESEERIKEVRKSGKVRR